MRRDSHLPNGFWNGEFWCGSFCSLDLSAQWHIKRSHEKPHASQLCWFASTTCFITLTKNRKCSRCPNNSVANRLLNKMHWSVSLSCGHHTGVSKSMCHSYCAVKFFLLSSCCLTYGMQDLRVKFILRCLPACYAQTSAFFCLFLDGTDR